MSLPLLTEATVLDDSGTLVMVWHVDLRHPRDRTPVTTLFKAGRKEHAIADLGTIRISKPVRFRNFGEGLIMDPAPLGVVRSSASHKDTNPTSSAFSSWSVFTRSTSDRPQRSRRQTRTQSISRLRAASMSVSRWGRVVATDPTS